MIIVNEHLVISEEEIVEKAVKASGPGGQHVNKTSTAVELRFDLAASTSLSEEVKARLGKLAGSRLTQDGVVVLFSQGSRSQEMNRREVRERLADLIRRALHKPRVRRPTKPTRASKVRRLDAKARRGGVKSLRSRPGEE